MIYADSSALVKLINAEAGSASLRAWLAVRPEETLATNVIGVIEVQRVAARIDAEAVALATLLLIRVDQLEVLGATYALAAALPPVTLRTLDALHVASAAQAPDVTAFVTYDHRMAEAAALVGLPVVSPS